MGEVLARMEGFPAPAGPLELVLERGTVVRISGRNGSGKTSLLRGLAGLAAPMRPTRVRLAVQAPHRSQDGGPPAPAHGPAGIDPGRLAAPALAASVGMVHQEARDGLVGLTVAGEYRFRGLAVGGGPAAGSRDLTVRREAGGLTAPRPGWRQDVASLSNGEARRLAIDLARGPLLLLDEPTEGLDAEGMAALRGRIVAARGTGCVVIVDHEGTLADLADVHVELEAPVDEAAWDLPPAGATTVLQAKAASLRLGTRHLVLPPVAIAAGLHVVSGPNGSGKTTLLRALAGLEGAAADVSGQAARPGQDVRWLSPHADDHLGRPTVADELARTDPEVAAALVPDHLAQRHPLRLSGGEKKRVALAKVLGLPAPAYLLDEPEAHLDAAGRAALQAIVAQRIREGSAVLVATHDPRILAAAHSVIRLEAP